MNTGKIVYGWAIVAALLSSGFSLAQTKNQKPPPPLIVQPNGQLVYTPDALGNRIPDFSYAGYMSGDKAIPGVPIKIVVPPVSGDATVCIQSAIDYVASLPLDKEGFRGTVLLQKGTYKIEADLVTENKRWWGLAAPIKLIVN